MTVFSRFLVVKKAGLSIKPQDSSAIVNLFFERRLHGNRVTAVFEMYFDQLFLNGVFDEKT